MRKGTDPEILIALLVYHLEISTLEPVNMNVKKYEKGNSLFEALVFYGPI